MTGREPRTPRLPLAILRGLAAADHRDAIEGDLVEGYRRRAEAAGRRPARRWLWSQVFALDSLRLRASARARRPFRTGTPMSRSRDRLAHRFDAFRRNLSWAIRSLRRRAAASAIIVATLAIAVGATTAIFTVVDRVLLRSLPYAEPDELAMVFRTVPRFGFDRSTASYPDFADWREQTTTFADLAAYGYVTRTRQADDGARRWVGYRFTANLLPLLGVPPAIGRGFSADDDRAGAPPVVLLSHRLFTERFGADPAVLDRTVTLDGQPTRVIGVMPEWYAFPGRSVEFWEPLRADAGLERSFNFLTVIGRLAPGETVETAQAELASLAARIDSSAEDANEGYGIFVEDRHVFEVRNARTALWVFMGAVGLLLVVACANIANLQLSRTLGRRQEIGVRSALGAGQGRLATQLLTESLVLAAAGGALGVAVAAGLLDVLIALAPPGIPRIADIGLDLRVLGFAAGASIAAGIAFGVAPALWGARQDAAGLVRESGGSGRSRWAIRLQRGFAAGQIAIAITLSIGAGLLLHSFRELTSVDPGFDPSGVLAARLPAPQVPDPEPPPNADQLSEEDLMAIMMPRLEAAAAGRIAFFEALVDRISAVAGVESVAYAYDMPFGEAGFSRYAAPEGSDPAEEMPVVAGNLVSPAYFEAMRVPLRAGRSFDEGDASGAPDVAVVNEALAERFWPGQTPVGERLLIGEGRTPLEVVGVVANSRQRSLEDPEPAIYYRPIAQASWPDEFFLVVRVTAAAGDVAAVIRREVAAMDPSLPVTGIATAASMIDATIAAPRFRTLVLTTFGGIALFVAVLGVYGVISYTVSDRTREMGIRMALGAAKANILGLVLRNGAVMAVAGIVIGLAGALALTRFIESMLFGVGARDALTFGITVAVALGVTLLACLIPARRAARVDPVESLRHE
ncbi:MAG: ABC transporter permease [Gemmatimonadota bacterium]|nr:ABC transporter permease [Gemmatimonadota bacterium]